MYGLGLDRRCQVIESTFGFKMSRTRLTKIYKRAGYKYGHPDWVFDRALSKEEELHRERVVFARRLLSLDHSSVIYLDETSFNPQKRPGKTWQNPRELLKVQQLSTRPKCMTVFGAIGQSIKPIFALAPSTNRDSFERFLRQIHLEHPTREFTVVLDNAGAHRGEEIRAFAAAYGLHFFKMPPYSCQLNSIERVWAELKRNFYRDWAQVRGAVDQERFAALIKAACDGVHVSERVVLSNRDYLRSLL